MIESLLIDRLIRQTELRAKAEAEVAIAKDGLQGMLQKHAELACQNALLVGERDRIAQTRDRLITEAEDRRKGLPKLAALYESTEELCKAIAQRGKGVKPEDDLVKKVRAALHDAFGYCDQIPF